MRLLKVLFVALVAVLMVAGGAILAAIVGAAGLLLAYLNRLFLSPKVKRSPAPHPRTRPPTSGGDVIEVTATEVKS